eukprot:m.43462 g.43462  ORF g.43462 m.43462 type:complete len:1044 (-) comp7112_c3_seq1:209-3340(-)
MGSGASKKKDSDHHRVIDATVPKKEVEVDNLPNKNVLNSNNNQSNIANIKLESLDSSIPQTTKGSDTNTIHESEALDEKKKKKKRKSGLVSVSVESQPDNKAESTPIIAIATTTTSTTTTPSTSPIPGPLSTNLEENNDDSDADSDEDIAESDSGGIFREFAAVIFRRANTSGSGKIDMNEFDSVLRSPTLSLNIGEGDAIELFYQFDHDNDGGLTYSEFRSCLNQLMCMAYSEIGDGKQNWVRIGFSGDESDALPLFFNRNTGEMTYETPSSYIELEEDSIQNFEYYVTPEGEVLTTYMDNGSRVCLDVDTQTWMPLSSDRMNSLTPLLNDSFTSFNEYFAHEDSQDNHIVHANQHDVLQYEMEHQPHSQPTQVHQHNINLASFNTVANPITGENVFTCINKEEMDFRLYADPVTSQLKHIPIEWEAELPEMISLLQELEEVYPHWSNIKEKVLALRLNNYDIVKTKEWKSNEISVSGQDVEGYGDAFDSIFVRNLKDHHDTAVAQVNDLNNKVLQLEATLENAQDETATAKRELGGSRKLVERQATRIFNLEEQLEKNESQPEAATVSTVEVERYEAKIKSLEAQVVALHEGNNEDINKALTEKGEELLRLQSREKELLLQLQESKKGSTAKYGKVQFQLQELKQENGLLKVELQESINAMKKIVAKLVAYNARSSERLTLAVREEETMRQRYQKECLRRKLLYNKIQELRGNIRVFCRCRFDDRVPCVIEFISENELLVPHPKGSKLFEFDQAYNPATTQERVYEDTSPIITSCVDGYNVCFLAYGQTGSGKTFTMMGSPENPGVNRRAIKELFEICDKSEEIDYTMDISLMEIYNDHIYDLLAGDQTPLKIREEKKKSGKKQIVRNYVENLIVRRVTSMENVTQVLEDGDKNRSVAATAMNFNSSRSHLLLQLSVAGVNKVTGVTSLGKLTLVDLAGSERVGKSQATGQRLLEAAEINKSLTSLGIVFQALASKQSHIPYRNSKLTHVLADSLGGDSKTCVFINISPAESNISETLSTLNFGQNIAKIEMGPVARNVKK